MEPQYMPPQHFGGQQQGFPPNPTSQGSGQQQPFQNVPLESPRPEQLPLPQGAIPSNKCTLPSGGPLSGSSPSNLTSPSQLPPSSQLPPTNQLPSSTRGQIPPSQLPPSIAQNTHSINSQHPSAFSPPLSKNEVQTGNVQNGPPQFQNGQMPGQNSMHQDKRSPSGLNVTPNVPSNTQNQNHFGPIPTSNQNFSSKPLSNQFGQTPLSGVPTFQSAGAPGLAPSTQNQFGQPPAQLQNQHNQTPTPQGISAGPPKQNQPMQQPLPSQNIPTQLQRPGQPLLPGQGTYSNQGPPMGQGSFPAQVPSFDQGSSGQGFPQNQRPPVGFTQGPPLGHASPHLSQGPPLPNQRSLSGQRPPLPGQGPMDNTNPAPAGQNPYQFASGPYPSGGAYPPQGPQMPPQSSNPQMVSNQITNQMLGMSLSGPRQYPGVPVKGTINGESGPHMPPPLGQPGFMNGQQTRGPQLLAGYPPMPSHGSMPGQGHMSGPGPMPGQGHMSGPGPMPGQGHMSGPGPMPGQGPLSGIGSMPGQGPVSGQGLVGPGYPQQNYQQPQQNRKLDPDQMPSPIQVTQDDQQNRSGVFITNQKGLVPPLVTTNFVVQDQGNASPRLIRSTMYNVPISQDILKQTAVPFSVVLSPMARHMDQEYSPPIVNFGELGPVRCIRCKAYMCPFMQFIDSGRRFQCLFCMATTDVPTEYFQHLDHTGQRMDRYERPELVLGTYEFVATTDYCRNNTLPNPPAIIFLIDVSYNNIKSGMVNLLCSQMKNIIQNLPVDQGQEKSNMKVGFITYNSSVHFYNIKGTLAAPQMLVVGDVQEMFMPLLDGFLSTPDESGPVIDALMEQIPSMFADSRETETVLYPAIQAGLEALKASECAGKLLVFHSTLPSAEAPGKLKNRDDRKVLGTDKEKTVLTPQSQVYNQLGQDCVGAGCSVDLFIFNNSYIDIATIGQVSRLTGGEVFKYTYFQADIDGERLINDIITDVSRPIAFDGIMRVRTSTGVRPTDFYGHFFMSNTTDIELASIDCDKAVAIEIKHDDKLSEEAGVYLQAALLYTSCSGQRRLRIINLSLKTCSQMADLYRSCDLNTLVNYLSKQAAYKLLDNNPKSVKDSIVSRAAQILATYRKNCASPSSAGQLILPECLKLLPLYVNCLLKSDALSGGSEMTIDDRSFVMQAVMTMDIPTSMNHFYPRLIPVHDIDPTKEAVDIPPPVRCSIEKMNEQGVYILENGIHMFLWFGLGVNPEFIQKIFGAPSAIQVDIDRVGLPELDNPLSIAIRNIIDEIRIERHRCMRLTLVRQREKLEPVFKHFLVEDRGTDGSPSYVDFLCHMHKEIRTLLS